MFLSPHLSVLKVHEYPDLIRSEADLDVCGGLGPKGVLVPEKEKTKGKETRRGFKERLLSSSPRPIPANQT